VTKYFLNSGGIGNSSDKGKAFFSDVLDGFGSNPKVLICNFAQPREDWEEKFIEDKNYYKNNFSNEIEPVLSLAFPEKFEDQIKETDVIYIHGGDDHLLQYWLKQFNLPEIWKNKIVATNSASSHALSKFFWTCDWRQCMDGLGIIPIKFLAHFGLNYGEDDPRGKINWDEAYVELENYKDKNLPIYALKEGEYVVFEI
jgi:hypothetical protein